MAVTWNPSDKSASITLSNGNLTATVTAAAWHAVRANISKSSGKWYWEVTLDDATGNPFVGGVFVAGVSTDTAGNYYDDGTGNLYVYDEAGNKSNGDGTNPAYGSAYTAGNIIGVALDLDGGTITFYKNNVSQGTAYSSISGTYYPCFGSDAANCACTANFSATPTYTPPSGYSTFEVASISISVSDQLNITESVALTKINLISVSDQLNITEAVTMLETSFINVSDQLNVTESVSREVNSFISVNDQLNITESVTIFINPLYINVSDQLNITESVTTALFQETLLLSVSDQLNVTENVQTGLDNFISVNDQLTVSESVSLTLINNISVSDQLNMTESATPGLVSFINVSDQLNITESVTKTVSDPARGLSYMRGFDQNLPVTMTKQDYPLGFKDTSVS